MIRHGLRIEPVLVGGHHQDDLRSGTESVSLAVGMYTALKLAINKADVDEALARIVRVVGQLQGT